MTNENVPMTPTAIAGKVLFESGVTVDNAMRMIDFNRRTEQNRGIDNSDLIAYFQYEIDSLTLYAATIENKRQCRVCAVIDSCINVPGRSPRCFNCGAWY